MPKKTSTRRVIPRGGTMTNSNTISKEYTSNDNFTAQQHKNHAIARESIKNINNAINYLDLLRVETEMPIEEQTNATSSFIETIKKSIRHLVKENPNDPDVKKLKSELQDINDKLDDLDLEDYGSEEEIKDSKEYEAVEISINKLKKTLYNIGIKKTPDLLYQANGLPFDDFNTRESVVLDSYKQ